MNADVINTTVDDESTDTNDVTENVHNYTDTSTTDAFDHSMKVLLVEKDPFVPIVSKETLKGILYDHFYDSCQK